jgi:hypothetical protein
MHNRVVSDTACLLAAGSSAAVADRQVRLILDRQHAGLCARDTAQQAGGGRERMPYKTEMIQGALQSLTSFPAVRL